jgi:hypothetical protein
MMIRNAKILGLALVAVLAMSAMVASAASATKFTAAKYPATVKGTQTGGGHVFEVGGGKVTCTGATFTGTLSAASEEMTMTPNYTGCTAFGFIGAEVTGFGSEGCDYLFTTNGKAHLKCPAGKDVTVDAGPCDITLEAVNNQNLATNTYTNTPANKVTVDTAVTNVHAVVTKTNFLCTVSAGTYANGKYSGTTEVEATNGGVADAIDVG